MNPKNPPAFPRITSREEGDYGKLHYGAEPGMTLRDWFAGQAMAGMGQWSPGDLPMNCFDRACWAYAQANAMLAERERQP